MDKKEINQEVMEILAKVSANFIMRDATTHEACGELGQAMGQVLSEEYVEGIADAYLEASLPIILQVYDDATS